jgi:hypothetical protein
MKKIFINSLPILALQCSASPTQTRADIPIIPVGSSPVGPASPSSLLRQASLGLVSGANTSNDAESSFELESSSVDSQSDAPAIPSDSRIGFSRSQGHKLIVDEEDSSIFISPNEGAKVVDSPTVIPAIRPTYLTRSKQQEFNHGRISLGVEVDSSSVQSSSDSTEESIGAEEPLKMKARAKDDAEIDRELGESQVAEWNVKMDKMAMRVAALAMETTDSKNLEERKIQAKITEAANAKKQNRRAARNDRRTVAADSLFAKNALNQLIQQEQDVEFAKIAQKELDDMILKSALDLEAQKLLGDEVSELADGWNEGDEMIRLRADNLHRISLLKAQESANMKEAITASLKEDTK